jgi:hypothetical protein
MIGKQSYEPAGVEQCFSPQYIAKLIGMSVRSVKRMLENEHGVLRIAMPRRLGSSATMRYTLRVPESVMRKIFAYWGAIVIPKPEPSKDVKAPVVKKPVNPSEMKVVKTLVKKGARPKPSDAAAAASAEPESAAVQKSEDEP